MRITIRVYSRRCVNAFNCGHRQSIEANTMMRSSKLPYPYWFIAMYLMTSTKRTFSALDIQRQLDHKRYQPVWEIMHKLHEVMGKRREEYRLNGEVEIDEAFFSTEVYPLKARTNPLRMMLEVRKSQKCWLWWKANILIIPKIQKNPK